MQDSGYSRPGFLAMSAAGPVGAVPPPASTYLITSIFTFRKDTSAP